MGVEVIVLSCFMNKKEEVFEFGVDYYFVISDLVIFIVLVGCFDVILNIVFVNFDVDVYLLMFCIDGIFVNVGVFVE